MRFLFINGTLYSGYMSSALLYEVRWRHEFFKSTSRLFPRSLLASICHNRNPLHKDKPFLGQGCPGDMGQINTHEQCQALINLIHKCEVQIRVPIKRGGPELTGINYPSPYKLSKRRNLLRPLKSISFFLLKSFSVLRACNPNRSTDCRHGPNSLHPCSTTLTANPPLDHHANQQPQHRTDDHHAPHAADSKKAAALHLSPPIHTRLHANQIWPSLATLTGNVQKETASSQMAQDHTRRHPIRPDDHRDRPRGLHKRLWPVRKQPGLPQFPRGGRMKPLRRTTRPNGMPLQDLDLVSICDQSGKHRAHGNHHRCSKRRQAINQHKRVTP